MKTLSFIGPKVGPGSVLGDFRDTKHPLQIRVKELILEKVLLHKTTHTLITTTMGGVEEWSCDCAKKNGMPYVILIPCDNFISDKTPQFVKNKHEILAKAAYGIIPTGSGKFSNENIKKKDAKLLESDLIYSFFGDAGLPLNYNSHRDKIADLLISNDVSSEMTQKDYWISI